MYSYNVQNDISRSVLELFNGRWLKTGSPTAYPGQRRVEGSRSSSSSSTNNSTSNSNNNDNSNSCTIFTACSPVSSPCLSAAGWLIHTVQRKPFPSVGKEKVAILARPTSACKNVCGIRLGQSTRKHNTARRTQHQRRKKVTPSPPVPPKNSAYNMGRFTRSKSQRTCVRVDVFLQNVHSTLHYHVKLLSYVSLTHEVLSRFRRFARRRGERADGERKRRALAR